MTEAFATAPNRPASRLSLVPMPTVPMPTVPPTAPLPPPRSVPLTSREQRTLGLIAQGCSTREVAQRLNYSERTIKNVLQAVNERLHYRNRTEAVACAVRNGWI